jgi:dihydrofolate reductase
MIRVILAVDRNLNLGNESDLVYSFEKDLKRFKELTMDSVVVMGRKTFDSIGKKLPGRVNVVISSKEVPGADKTFSNFESVYELSKVVDVWVIGGKSLYDEFIPNCDELYLTLIDNVKTECSVRLLELPRYLNNFISTKKEVQTDIDRISGMSMEIEFINYIRYGK